MKQRVINLIKYNKVAYALYYRIMSLCINILKLFVKPDDRLILFNSFAGRKYDDSPKTIFSIMKYDPRFKDYKFVWAFHHPEDYEIDGAEKVKTDGFEYFRVALAARVWVTNSSVERGLNFKGKRTFYLNTWHGSPIKKMGSDICSGNQSFAAKGQSKVDIMNTQSCFEADIFSRCFGIPRNRFIEVGLPRNDELVSYTAERKKEIKNKLDIPEEKQVILYCPTFREYEKDENLGVVLAPPMDLKKWKEKLNDRYVLLFRAHYEVAKVMDINDNDFVRNVTDYPSLNDLMIASDVLISDYSSIFFDFSIMDKCMLHFTYDFNIYQEKRGMYFDIRRYINGADNEDDVIDILNNLDTQSEIIHTIEFRKQYVDYYGNAAQKTVDCIADNIL